jgi:hypothetical protein
MLARSTEPVSQGTISRHMKGPFHDTTPALLFFENRPLSTARMASATLLLLMIAFPASNKCVPHQLSAL